MRTSAFLRDIRRAAKAHGLTFELVREGAAHSIWRCGTATTSIPRHGEIGPKMMFEIRKDLERALGKDWWR